ncbi:hypothetical protein HPG69_015447, partial [Diceros bicornis minor]
SHVMEAAHCFYGTKKLLEVWFSQQQAIANQGSGTLRIIPRSHVTKTAKQGAYGLRVAVFPSGAAYCLGRMNSDCSFMYSLDFPESRVIS